MRFYRLILVIFAAGLVLAGCESDPIPTAGSAGQMETITKPQEVPHA